MRLPNFFLVGAPKSGTTSLLRYLEQHPDIATASFKEPCFFAPEVPDSPGISRDWHEYLALFAHARTERAIGEGSVAYLSSPHAAGAIRAKIPDARILMLLRDPADRLFAHYAAARIAGATTLPFDAWLSTAPAADGAIRPGFYAQHLSRFLDHFPKPQISIALFDDFEVSPSTVVSNFCTFLAVDPQAPIDTSERHNVTTRPRWPALGFIRRPIRRLTRRVLPGRAFEALRSAARAPADFSPTPGERAHGIALYRNDIRSFGEMIGRDLSEWLRVEG